MNSMTDSSSLEISRSKSFIANHRLLLKQYAQKNRDFFGPGVIFVNLLMISSNTADKVKFLEKEPGNGQELTIHQPISYIPQGNFWIRTIGMKIRKRYQIDIQQEKKNKTFIVFIKDVDLEHFSIYTINS